MPGSIRKRADRGKNVYELRVFLGRDDYGRVRHKSTIFRGPLRAAEEDRRAAEHMGLLLSGGVVDVVPHVGPVPRSDGVNRSVTPD